jgi:hypothetical protein
LEEIPGRHLSIHRFRVQAIAAHMEMRGAHAGQSRKHMIVVLKVFVTLPGEYVQRRIARVLIQEFHKLLRFRNR